MTDYNVIKKLLSRPIAFHRVFAELSGGATSGLFLSQLWYWHDKTKDPEGWLFKTYEEWREETCLSRSEIDRARRSLKELGILEEKKEGIPLRLFYRLDVDALLSLIAESGKQACNPSKFKFAESSEQQCRIQQTAVQDLANSSAESSKHIYKDSEITTEITAETSTEREEGLAQKTDGDRQPPIFFDEPMRGSLTEQRTPQTFSTNPEPQNVPPQGVPVTAKRSRDLGGLQGTRGDYRAIAKAHCVEGVFNSVEECDEFYAYLVGRFSQEPKVSGAQAEIYANACCKRLTSGESQPKDRQYLKEFREGLERLPAFDERVLKLQEYFHELGFGLNQTA